ncbi:hypothetical protein Vretifemale_3004 [Volvox reticuliferus]|uniref:Uncharacterized protein n=1 Tax=Volvox reticuliferus TaxID=1737510 RepID=A0A8J4FED4_9CHLO|nr:hypothetical protein Vretifemale_3004 [Volvox reticuliferus]
MELHTLERATNTLRTLLLEKVPDVLLQAECGGGLELPTPLPWGFARIPSLHELTDIAMRELEEELRAKEEVSTRHRPSRSSPQDISAGEERCLQQEQRQQLKQRRREQKQESPMSMMRQRNVDDDYRPQGGQGICSEIAAEVDHEGREGHPAVVHRNSPADGWPLDVPGEARGKMEECGRSLERGDATGDWAAEALSGGAAVTGAAACPQEPCNGEGDTVGPVDGGPGGGDADSCQRVPYRIEDPSLLPESEPAAPCKPYSCRAFLETMMQSRTFCSPHCEGAMAETMGMTDLYDGLAGSTLWPPPRREDLEALRGLLKDHINSRWALEAVKQGVAVAKQGALVLGLVTGFCPS